MKYKVVVNDQLEYELSDEQVHSLDVVPDKEELHVLHAHKSWQVEILHTDWNRKVVHLRVNGEHYHVRIIDELDILIQQMGLSANTAPHIADIKAPMPGLVVDVLVSLGEQVEKGQPLLILEAMKMENLIKAPGSGTVREIHVQKGGAVEKGQSLLRLD